MHEPWTAPPRAGQRLAGPLSESQEVDLAGRLLEASGPAGLAEVIARVVRAGGGAPLASAASGIGRALRAQLQQLARHVVPFAAHRIGAPGEATARRGARALGMSLEGLSPEDAEFELARSFVRFAGAAARRASSGPYGPDPGRSAAQAMAGTASGLFPGLLPLLPSATSRAPRTGRWVRDGNAVVLFGVR